MRYLIDKCKVGAEAGRCKKESSGDVELRRIGMFVSGAPPEVTAFGGVLWNEFAHHLGSLPTSSTKDFATSIAIIIGCSSNILSFSTNLSHSRLYSVTHDNRIQQQEAGSHAQPSPFPT